MEMNLSSEEKLFLIRVAREALESVFSRSPLPEYYKDRKIYSEKSGVFIKITINNETRAYSGILQPQKTLIEAIQECALKAGFQDERTRPLMAAEMERAVIHIALVCSIEDIAGPGSVDPHTEGLWAEDGFRQGVLLPWDIERLGLTPEEAAKATCVKAGIADSSRAKLRKLKLLSFGENA